MRLTELQGKDIVNVNDGKLIGKIIDLTLNDSGVLEDLIIEKSKFFVSMFSSKNEVKVKWKQIKKIGDDVILVELHTSEN